MSRALGRRPPCRRRAGRAAVLPRELLAADRPVRDGGGDRRDRPDAAGRHRRPALARARVLRRRRRLRLRYLAGARAVSAGCWRCSARSLLAGLAGAAVQPDRRPPARHLPRPRLARPGLHRPAHPAQRDRHHRRLQRRRDVEPFSLFGFSFSNTDPDTLVVLGVPYGRLERLWYLGPGPGRARGLVRAQPRPQPPGPRAGDAARQRGRGGGDGRRRRALQGGGVHRVVDVRRPRRRAARARVRPHRPGVASASCCPSTSS